MSTHRIVSGSTAAWASILVSTAAQVGLVPIYLSHWDASYYCIWLAVLAVPGILVVVTSAYQEFVGYEFLKIGGRDLGSLSKLFWSTVPLSFALGFLELVFVGVLVVSGGISFLLGQTSTAHELVVEVELVVMLVVGVWTIFGTIGTLLVYVLAPLGYYPQMAWWGVFSRATTTLAPTIAVIYGAGIQGAGITLVVVSILSNIFMLYYIQRILRAVGFGFQPPAFSVGVRALWTAQLLVLTKLFETGRAAGVRLVLLPLAGAVNLAAFATLRTVANVVIQGLSTVTGPLLPELMRVLKDRDQPRTEAAFATIWVVLVVVLAPAMVVLQVVIEPLFSIWTRGQIVFDPALFGILSISVLVFAWSQPAIAIIKGNNLLKPQLAVSGIAAGIVLGGMLILVPLFGILGAGMALLAAELFAAYRFYIVAVDWFNMQGMIWPRHSARLAGYSVWIAVFSISILVGLPDCNNIVVVLLAFVLFGINVFFYWRSVPAFARQRLAALVGKRLSST